MTLDEFASDAWDQIVYLTNMGDTVSALLATQVGGAIGSGSVSDWNSAANTQRDVGGYLKEFSYDEQAKTFRIVVNGAALSDDLGDMTLQIACNDEGKIANMYGSFSLVASFSVNIDYENVTATDGNYTLSLRDLKETWAKENYTMTVMSGVTESASSVLGVAQFTSTVTLQNGKKKYTVPVQYGAPMSELFDLEDTETARFRGWFTEENGDGERITAETCDNGLGGKTLYAYWENYVTIRLDAGEGKADASSVKETPTDLWQALQSVNVSAREGYSFAGWQDEEGNFVTAENIADYARDGVTLYAAYEKSSYVTLRSDITFTVNGETDETKAVDTYSYYRKDGEAIPAATAEGYLFVGWFVNTEDGWAVASDELCAQDAVTLWAVWLKDDLNVTITTCSLSTFKLWTIKGSYAGGGFAEGMSQTIASAVGYEQTTEVWYRLSNDGETVRDTLNSGKSVTVSGGTFSKSSMSSLLGGTYGGATVRITYVIGGITVTVEASSYKQK
jgi:hypothetical protein